MKGRKWASHGGGDDSLGYSIVSGGGRSFLGKVDGGASNERARGALLGVSVEPFLLVGGEDAQLIAFEQIFGMHVYRVVHGSSPISSANAGSFSMR
jgi:hypothetical protein